MNELTPSLTHEEIKQHAVVFLNEHYLLNSGTWQHCDSSSSVFILEKENAPQLATATYRPLS